MRPGIPERQTHDYARHGVTCLFAALEVATGTVIDACYPRHRHQEFLKFLKKVAAAYPSVDLHVCAFQTPHWVGPGDDRQLGTRPDLPCDYPVRQGGKLDGPICAVVDRGDSLAGLSRDRLLIGPSSIRERTKRLVRGLLSMDGSRRKLWHGLTGYIFENLLLPAPPAGFEPAHTAPEAVALSPELWGLAHWSPRARSGGD
jgi:hypothetical protein